MIPATSKASGAASRRRSVSRSPRRHRVADLPELLAYEAAFMASPTPTLLLRAGRLVRINAAARRLLGGRPSFAYLSSLGRSSNAERLPSEGTITSRCGELIATRASSRLDAPVQVWHLSRAQHPQPDVSSLTARERCVLSFLVKGMTDAEIGLELGVSVLTIHKHVAHILAKSGVHSRMKLAALVLNSV